MYREIHRESLAGTSVGVVTEGCVDSRSTLEGVATSLLEVEVLNFFPKVRIGMANYVLYRMMRISSTNMRKPMATTEPITKHNQYQPTESERETPNKKRQKKHQPLFLTPRATWSSFCRALPNRLCVPSISASSSVSKP